MAKKLTVRKVEQTRPNPSKRREMPDGGKPGLYLVIQPSGRKSWAVRYRVNGQPRKLTLDGFPGLATARRLAQDALDMVAEGKDPAAEKQALKSQYGLGSNLFSAVTTEFLERHVKRNTRASSARETERFLAKDVLPKWGKKRIQEITRRDVLDLLDGIVDRRGTERQPRLGSNTQAVQLGRSTRHRHGVPRHRHPAPARRAFA